MILPSTFKNIDQIAWVILTDNTFETFPTAKMIIDDIIFEESAFVFFAQEAFVRFNSDNHIRIKESIIRKKCKW